MPTTLVATGVKFTKGLAASGGAIASQRGNVRDISTFSFFIFCHDFCIPLLSSARFLVYSVRLLRLLLPIDHPD